MAHDGALRWRTLHAPRLVVHYPSDCEALARRVAVLGEDALTTLAVLLPYKLPRRLEISIDDYGDSSNGYAINFPYDRVHLLAAPPRVGSDLEGNGDWLRALVFHEISHILHMAMTEHVVDWVNTVLGRVYLPNTQLPRFWLEGLATWVETRFVSGEKAVHGARGQPSRGGRIEGAVFLGRLRAALLDDTWPSLLTLTGAPLSWPRGRGWYVFGSWLHDYQARKYGAERTTAFIKAYGIRVIPYAINALYQRIYQRSALAMWDEARRDLQRRVVAETTLRRAALVSPGLADAVTATAAVIVGASAVPNDAPALALSPPRRLTRDGEGRGRVRTHPDGHSVVFARSPADDLARIERFWPADGRTEVMHRCELDCDDALVTPDGRWLLFIGSRPDRLVYRPGELIAVPLKDGVAAGPARRLSQGWRAREIAIDDTGRWLAFVAIAAGRSEVRVVALPGLLAGAAAGGVVGGGVADRSGGGFGVRVVQSVDAAEIVGTPAFMGDRLLAYSVGRGRRRDVMLQNLDPGGRPVGAPRRLALLPAQGLRAVGVGSAKPGYVGAVVGWASDLIGGVVDGRGWLGAVVEAGAIASTGAFVPGTFRDAARLDLGLIDVAVDVAVDVAHRAQRAAAAGWTLTTQTQTALTSATWLGDGSVVAVEMRGNGLDLVAAAAATVDSTGAGAPAGAVAETASIYAPPAVTLRVTDYDFWPTLRPFSWVPVIEAGAVGTPVDAFAVVMGFDLHGADPLELYRWTAILRSDLGFERPFAVASLTVARFVPTWSLVAATLPGTAWTRRGFALRGFATRSASFRFSGELALPSVRGGWSLQGSVRAGQTWFANEQARFAARVLPDEPFGPTPYRLELASLGELAAAIAYQRAERYPNSITTERLTFWTLALTFADPLLGDDGRALRVDVRTSHNFPLGHHRVLALRARLGHALTLQDGDVPYRVDGVGPTDLTALLYGPGGSDFGAIRGLTEARSGSRRIAGRSLAWASAELYLPLVDVGHGFDTLPLWLGRLWAVAFYDFAGVLAGEEAKLRDRQTSAGFAAARPRQRARLLGLR